MRRRGARRNGGGPAAGLSAFARLVASYRKRRRRQNEGIRSGEGGRSGRWDRSLYLGLDVLGIAGWTWLAIVIPLPVISEYLTVKNAIVAFVAVIWVGRTIVDSFYERD